jgi:lysyl-tRNA synthetase class 2
MLEDLKKERELKRDALQKAGLDVYPAKVLRTHTISEALNNFLDLESSKKEVYLVGRVMGKRGHGGVFFLDLRDENGDIQIVSAKDKLENFDLLQNNLDIGDFVEVAGSLFSTQRGEKSIQALKLRIIVKTLLPIPSERFGLQDSETRLRQRYVELLLNSDLRATFIKKSKFWNEFRSILIKNGFFQIISRKPLGKFRGLEDGKSINNQQKGIRHV